MKNVIDIFEDKPIKAHLIGWLCVISLNITIFINIYDISTAIIYGIMNMALAILLFYSNLQAINRWVEKQKTLPYFLFLLCAFVISAVLRFLMNKYVVLGDSMQLPPLSPDARIKAFAILNSFIVLFISFIYGTMKNRYRKEKQYQSIIDEQNQAKIQFLKAQINPHFLFNTLNNIYSLTVIKSDIAPKMILLLSDLLRYVIYEGKEGKVSLEKEILHIRKFIELYQMRNEEDKNVSLSVEGDIQKITIEPMILIPFIENCFKHSDLDFNPDGYIRIEIKIQTGILFFHCKNTKNDNNIQKDKTGGVGLENIEKRLHLLYDGAASFELVKNPDTFEVNLKFPYHQIV